MMKKRTEASVKKAESKPEVKLGVTQPQFRERLIAHDLEVIMAEEAEEPQEYLRSYDS